MVRALLVLMLLALSACASTRTRPVDAIAAADASFMAGEVAAYVAAELPPASSTVWLALPPAPPASKAAPSPLGPAVAAALRDRGFAVVEDSAASDGSHTVSVDALELAGANGTGTSGMLLKVSIDGAAASRWYEREASGGLAAGGAYTVRAAR